MKGIKTLSTFNESWLIWIELEVEMNVKYFASNL